MSLTRRKTMLPSSAEALPGRDRAMAVTNRHHVKGTPIQPPFPEGMALALFGLGCFWGAERRFWEGHDPTQGMRQGNDVGTQYRSAIYACAREQLQLALASRDRYQDALTRAGAGRITTEISEAPDFYYAEDYHQQYLASHPFGYCGLGSTGVPCPDPAGSSRSQASPTS